MANEEQLAILKQGVEVWNKWRKDNGEIKIDLSEANFHGDNLKKVNLSGANLNKAKFSYAELYKADFRFAELNDSDFVMAELYLADFREADINRSKFFNANLRGADFNKASLIVSDLKQAMLWQANLNETNLEEANLEEANLEDANLSGAYLSKSNLRGVNLKNANLGGAYIGQTLIAGIDLSETNGLENIRHLAPSHIDVDTIRFFKGLAPENFLRGSGLSDADIEYTKLSNPELSNEQINKILYKIYDLRAGQALQISPLFISYSHADGAFLDKLESQLNEKGVRFWRDIHDMKAGRIEKQIDTAISQNRTVLLVLSEHSIKSDWVEHEVRKARGLEKDMRRDVLCPIALDDSWKSSPWPARVMEQIMEYNILDFSAWEDNVKFEGMFRKLIDGLELFYKDKSHGK